MILASYMFIPWTSETGIPLPVLGLGWTLNYEMYFYLVFSFALRFTRVVGLTLLVVGFAAAILLGTMYSPTAPFLGQVTNWLLLEFIAGAALGMAFVRGYSIPFRLAVFILFSASVLYICSLLFKENGTLTPFLRVVFYGIPATALVAISVLSERIRLMRVPKLILLVGAASYSLYLTHLFSLPLTQKIVTYLGLRLHRLLEVPLLIGVSIVVAIVFYQFYEAPTQKLLRKAAKTRNARKWPQPVPLGRDA